jgi:hypothetical protein
MYKVGENRALAGRPAHVGLQVHEDGTMAPSVIDGAR